MWMLKAGIGDFGVFANNKMSLSSRKYISGTYIHAIRFDIGEVMI